jgi:hypothetical protein
MTLLGLILLMALVLVIFSVLALMSRVVTALERIEQLLEQVVGPAGQGDEDAPQHLRGR